MVRRPPRSTRTDTLFPYTTLFRSGERLDEIVSLDYSTFRQSGSPAVAPSLQLDFDNDLTDASASWMGRMVYEPYHANTVADATWQAWTDRKSTRLNSSH